MAENETRQTLDSPSREITALEEVARWIRFLGFKAAKEVMMQTFVSETDREIYALSDGKSSREIENILEIPHRTITRKWIDWYSQGLMHDSVKWKGRKEASFKFEEFGLPLPNRIRKLREAEESVNSGLLSGSSVVSNFDARKGPSTEE